MQLVMMLEVPKMGRQGLGFVKLPFLKDEICEVFYSYSMYVFHDQFDFLWGYLEIF